MSKPEIVVEPGSLEIVITMTFDAPRELVFKAYTDPALITQWWGPRYLTTEIDTLEAREGGRWRFVQSDSDGNAHAFHGVFHEVSAPDRIVQTFEYEGWPGHAQLETAVFEISADARGWSASRSSRLSRPATGWSAPAWKLASMMAMTA